MLGKFMDRGSTEEKNLLRRLNAKEEQAFEFVFHQYYASLCFFANKLTRDPEAARDVVQEVFIRFFEKTYDFPNLIAFKAYLYSCVQHKALNYIEKLNNRATLREKLEPEGYAENEYFLYQVESEILEEIFTAIEQLPPECCRIFKMSYIDRMSIREIMDQLHVAESTIKTQRQRAKKILRERLKDLYLFVPFLFF